MVGHFIREAPTNKFNRHINLNLKGKQRYIFQKIFISRGGERMTGEKNERGGEKGQKREKGTVEE